MASADYTGKDQRLKYLFQNGGGGGSSTLDGLSDVSLTTPTDGQVLAYDANADEWVNSSMANPSSIASMSDTDIQSPTDGQTLVYNSTSAKWENASGGGSTHTYSTTEQVVGTWIDGKPIYETTINVGALPNNTSISLTAQTPSDLEYLIDVRGFCVNHSDSSHQRPLPLSAGGSNDIRVDLGGGYIRITTYTDWSNYDGYLTIQYTKSTT